MALVIWNDKGVRSAVCQREILKLLIEKNVDVFEIIETKCTSLKFQEAMTVLSDEWQVT